MASHSDLQAERLEVPDDIEAIWELFMAKGWGDGLPIVPPTPERVERMLGSRDPLAVLGLMPPQWAPVTLERLAVNAVMAGCRPAYFGVVIAAVAAMLAPEFNLLGIQATTNPAAPLLIVNGPIRRALNMNAGANTLGQGNRANATIGRAVRLAMVNIGGARPGELDRATHGLPIKYSFVVPENEEESPFAPLTSERGLPPETSAATVVGASCVLNIADLFSRTAEGLLKTLAHSMNAVGTNNMELGVGPVVILSPEHARLLAAGGYDKAAVRAYLHRHAVAPASAFSPENLELVRRERAAHYAGLEPDTLISVADTPDDILLLVAGGPGAHTLFIPTFGDTEPVTRIIPEVGTDAE